MQQLLEKLKIPEKHKDFLRLIKTAVATEMYLTLVEKVVEYGLPYQLTCSEHDYYIMQPVFGQYCTVVRSTGVKDKSPVFLFNTDDTAN